MKKAIFLAALMAASSASFAQKAVLTKAKTTLQEATVNPKAPDYAKIDEVWTMLQQCMQDPATSKMGETYSNAGRVQAFYMSKMMNDRSANGNMDMDKFFDNQVQIVDLYSKACKWDNTPNEKGKYIIKDENERKKNKALYQQIAVGPRSNIFIAASNYVMTEPEKCIKYLDIYEATYSDPLFEGVLDPATDTTLIDAAYFRATALKSKAKTAADTTALIPLLEKSLASKSYAVMACNDLMTIYKSRGQMDKWLEVCDNGMAKDPTQKFFPKVKLEYLAQEKKFDEAIALCQKLKQQFPDDEYAFYTEGVINFTNDKMPEAIAAFKAATDVKPDYAEAWSSMGTCTWKIARDNASKVDVATKYINEAIGYFKKAQEYAPENPNLWGYFLYQAYTSLKKPAEAAKYKEYKDN